jgi:hypothetical protein
MIKQPYILLSLLILLGCTNRDQADDQNNSISSDGAKTEITKSATALTIDPILLNKYQTVFQNDTISSEKLFLSKLLNIVRDFNGRKLDTTVLTIGNIDGDDVRDTIFSRVYYDSDSIFVDSKWIKNNHISWEYKYANPYLDFESDLFNYDSRNIWAIFAVGIVYGPPEIHSRLDGPPPDSLVYRQGIADLKEVGIKVTEADYENYLQNFKGELLVIGEPETREGLWIWYKPAGRLISYFQP